MNLKIPTEQEASGELVIDNYGGLANELQTSFKLRGIHFEVDDIDFDRVIRLVPGSVDEFYRLTGKIAGIELRPMDIVSISRQIVEDYLNGEDSQ